MAPRIPDTYLWLGLGVFIFFAVKGVAYGLHTVYDLTEVEPPSEEPHAVAQGTEDDIPLRSLRVLATQHSNLEIRKAATAIITTRVLGSRALIQQILADSRRPTGTRAHRQAQHALALLRAVNGVDVEDLDQERQRWQSYYSNDGHGDGSGSGNDARRRARPRTDSSDGSTGAVVGMGEVRMGDAADTAAEVGFEVEDRARQAQTYRAQVAELETLMRRNVARWRVHGDGSWEAAGTRGGDDDGRREDGLWANTVGAGARTGTANINGEATEADELLPNSPHADSTPRAEPTATFSTPAPADPHPASPAAFTVTERNGASTVVLGSRPSAAEWRRRREQSHAAFMALRPRTERTERARSGASEAEVARRRQRREAVVINEGDRPISQEDIIQRPV